MRQPVGELAVLHKDAITGWMPAVVGGDVLWEVTDRTALGDHIVCSGGLLLVS